MQNTNLSNSFSFKKLLKQFILFSVPVLAVVSYYAVGQSTAPSIPSITLAPEPLYAKGTRDKPTLTLALSVEFPTVGAQYTKAGSSTVDDTYTPATEYVGYYNSDSCYAYNNTPTETPVSPLTTTDYKRFDRIGAATARECGGTGFSGNFMNWATSSAIDVLRLSLTGGDRIIDTSDLTILQRAVIQTSMFNNSYFPSKVLNATYVGGAVPSTLKGTHNGNIYVANCLNRIHFGTAATGNCGAPGNNSNLGVTGGTAGTTALATTENYFFARVKVCDASSGTLVDTREFDGEKLCLKYPGGNYKPVGNLQKYSDRVRISVFGYLNQSGTPRYGGVLRAPMKYVGPKYYDVNGSLVSGTNPEIEWNETTGVFVRDPQGTVTATAEGISGAINYLNQFGRTGPTPGTYKANDPVGELYYESLRYLQGLPPTSGTTEATSPTYGMTAAQKDGFPVYSSWTDPHAGGSSAKDYTCQKNNIVTIADIGTHADKYIPGNTRTGNDDLARPANVAANEPNFVDWTKIVGAFEAGSSIAYTDSSGTSRTTDNPNSTTGQYKRYTNFYISGTNNLSTQNTGAGSAAYYIAGMAYWAKNYDIRGAQWTNEPTKQRPGMRVKTFAIDVNQNASSADTDTRRRSQLFLAAKYGGFDDASGRGNPYYSKNSSGSLVADNSVWDKSSNVFNPTQPGEARTHFLASENTRSLLTTIRGIFEAIAQEGNSIAGGAISTQRLTSVGGFIYQAQFDAADWSGDLVSYPVSVDSSNVVTISNTPQWSAGAKLNAKIALDTTAASRKIFVGKVTPDTTSNAVEFKTLSDLETGLQTALSKATPISTADSNAQLRINYLRGDRSLEGTTFRKRGNLLGDIINSGVAFSGEPSTRLYGSSYSTFYTTNKNRRKILYVGANDGYMHAFDSSTGEEVFAYVPSWVAPKLSALTNSTYNTGNHQSFLDGSPVVAEAKVGGTDESDSSAEWKTVLVSGTGGGGQGVFALDVTDPDAFAASKVLWEFTDRDDPDMGNVVGRPQILKFRISGSGATVKYKWFAVVASGVNNYVNDGYFSSTGRPALFLIDIGKPLNTAWSLGTNYYKISFPFNSSVGATTATGVINFKATGGPADEVALIYAGDLHGNLWKLNFGASSGFSDWAFTKAEVDADATVVDRPIDKLSSFKSTASPYKAIPFFIAKDNASTPVVQPISMEPSLVRGPAGGIIVSFGTGKYLESSDNLVTTTTQVQSMYALFDNNSSSSDTGSPTVATISGKSRLIAGSIDSSGVITTPAFVWGRPLTNGDSTQRAGWYFNYPTAGERQISGFGVFGNKFVFGSVIPPDAVLDACGSGTGYQYTVNIANGSGQREVSQVGLLGEPFVLEVGGAAVTVSGSTGRRVKTTTGQIILQGSSGLKAISSQPTDTSIVGRLSWRQISNYQDLKNAP
jgi:type IV pilus assembly protein PilY1